PEASEGLDDRHPTDLERGAHDQRVDSDRASCRNAGYGTDMTGVYAAVGAEVCRVGPTTSARRRGLAHRRTPDVGREEMLSRQPASEDRPAHLSNHHQGALGLRAGSPAYERRTRS